MPDIIVQHSFYPVGQGLFSSGVIRVGTSSGPSFRWVYDCGTTSSQVYLDEALECFLAHDRIDLVTISHFDQDHINGMVKLLMKAPVEDLLLPYMPLWQRIVLIIEANVTFREPLARFLLDPVGFISEIPNANVKRVLFAMPSGGTEEPVGSSGPDGDRPLDERSNARRMERARNPARERNREFAGNKFTIGIETIDNVNLPPEGERRRYKEEAQARSHIEVEYLKEGSAITVSNL